MDYNTPRRCTFYVVCFLLFFCYIIPCSNLLLLWRRRSEGEERMSETRRGLVEFGSSDDFPLRGSSLDERRWSSRSRGADQLCVGTG